MKKENSKFVASAGIILIITALAKLWSSAGAAKILAFSDPILRISYTHLMMMVGVAELAVGIICLVAKNRRLSLILVAWLGTNILAYRLGLLGMGWHGSCSCLGNLTDALHIQPQTADTAMKIILAYLLIGSYATLFWLWRQRKRLPLQQPS